MAYALDTLQYQPPKIYAERIWLQGAIVTGVFYGIVVALYALCVRSLWSRMCSREGSTRKNWFFLVYVNFVFALSTLYVITNAHITQLGFINHRDYPGGPSTYESEVASAPLNVAFVVSNWCADALMIWRCAVVYRDCKFYFIVTGLGYFLMLASVVTGSLWVIIASRPGGSRSGWMSFTFLFPYISVSLALNIFVSILTAIRLLYHRARISKVLGPGYGQLYAGFAAIIIESAAIYSTCSLLYIIPYAVNSPLANAFMQILGEAQVVAPLLIIHRISEGKALTKNATSGGLASSGGRLVQNRWGRSPVEPRLNVQVALECVGHTDHDRTINFVDDSKSQAV